MQELTVFNEVAKIQEELATLRSKGVKVGFVPTMGALHQGHLSLVEAAKKDCDYVVVSIFVNPTQFNNQDDLAKYPRTEEQDIVLLSEHGVNGVFMPNVEEIYPVNYQRPSIALGAMATVMEGKFRPGHFDGMVEVVYRLFDIVQPNAAFFGEKDFQQLAIIRYMVDYFNLEINIVGCPIIREESGLAMSSRNQRLSDEELVEASKISAILNWINEHVETYTLGQIKKAAEQMFSLTSMELEYLSFVDSNSLMDVEDWQSEVTCCVAVYCGDVRLIDNIQLVG